MQRDEFAGQVRKLAEGFSQNLTPQRIEAVWTLYGHHPTQIIQRAVLELLAGSRYPSATELDRAITRSCEDDQAELSASLHADDRQPWRPDWESGSTCPALRARFYTRLARWFYAQPAWPQWALMETLLAELSEKKITVMDEETIEVDPPDDWRDYAVNIWRQNQPGTKPGRFVQSLVEVTQPSPVRETPDGA